MVRTSKLVLAAVVVGVSAIIGLAYAGRIGSVVSPDQLPGALPTGAIGIVGVLGIGFLVSLYLDRRAWKQMGKQVGLTAGGGPQFASGPPEDSDKPTLTGTVDGRPVRAWAYSTGGGQNSNSKTYTVVESELQAPVDWHATFGGPGAEQAPDDAGVGVAQTQTVDDVSVRGDVPDDIAHAVLTEEVKHAVGRVEGEVSVGNAGDQVVGGMMDELDDAGGVGASLAKGMLSAAGGGDSGPPRTVEHRDRGLLTDEETLQNRLQATAAVADAVDNISATRTPENH